MISFPPGLILIVAAVLLPLMRSKKAFNTWALLASVSTFVVVLLTYIGGDGIGDYTQSCEYALLPGLGDFHITLELMQLNAPTKIFATVFSLMAIVGVVYSFNQDRRIELPAALLYAGSAICVTYAGDLLTMFLFWELMAVGSAIVVWSGGQKDSARAGQRYVAVHLLGGAILMAGIVAYYVANGDLALPNSPLTVIADGSYHASAMVEYLTSNNIAAWLIMIGVLVNAGAPFLGAWLPDAYPEASVSGTVFLSAFTTKTAVFVLMMLFAGADVLVWVGLAMAIYGLIYALIENDMRRILAYAIINQLGFMVCAVGIGTPLTLCGASAHAFASVVYKALLLMAAGSVLYQTGKRKCTDLGGLYKTMPITMICTLIGGMTISAMPLTSSFTTKSLITSGAALEYELGHNPLYMYAWFVLMAASAGGALYAGIKFPWLVFFNKDSGLRPSDPPKNMTWSMIFLAALCVIFGFPGISELTLYTILPFAPMVPGHGAGAEPHLYSTWSASHVISQFALLAATGFVFFSFVKTLSRTVTITIDSDWIYRRLIPSYVWGGLLLPAVRWLGKGHEFLLGKVPGMIARGVQSDVIEERVNKSIELGGTTIRFSFHFRDNRRRDWAVGGVLLVITVMLFMYLLLNFNAI